MCYSYKSGIRNASRDQQRIIEQLLILRDALQVLRALLEREEAIASSRYPALIELLNKSNGIPRCRDELERLKAKLEIPQSHGRIQRLTQSLFWPLKDGDVNLTINQLKNCQRVMGLAMNVCQVYVRFTYLRIDLDQA